MDKKISLAVLALVVATLIIATMNVGAQTAEVQNVTSVATIEKYAALALSVNLSDGISFGTLSPDTSDNNATDNDNRDICGSGCVYNGNTSMNITRDPDSNVNIQICITSNDSLRDGSNYIGNANYTNASILVTDFNSAASAPALPGVALTTNQYVLANSSTLTAAGEQLAFRFWLDVPAGQAPGTYSNEVSFKAIEAGQLCTWPP
jgi:hypothetical protein